MAEAGRLTPWQPGRVVILGEHTAPNPYTGRRLATKEMAVAMKIARDFEACCAFANGVISRLIKGA